MRPITILLALIAILYPFLVYFGLQVLSPNVLACLLLFVLLLRLKLGRSIFTDKRHNKWLFLTIVLVLGFSLITNLDIGIRFYPVATSLFFFGVFAYSLWFPPTVIERFARIKKPDLSPEGVIYTKNVTKIWCAFFILNSAIAAYTSVFTDIKTWTLYNGFISYCLIALLAGIEFLVRIRVQHKHSAIEKSLND